MLTSRKSLEASKDFLEHPRARSGIIEGKKSRKKMSGFLGPRGSNLFLEDRKYRDFFPWFFALVDFTSFLALYSFYYFFHLEYKKSRGNISTAEDVSPSNKLPRGLESPRRIYNLEEKLQDPRDFFSSRLTTLFQRFLSLFDRILKVFINWKTQLRRFCFFILWLSSEHLIEVVSL